MKLKLNFFKNFSPIVALIATLAACGDRFDTIQPPGASVLKPTVIKSKMPNVNVNVNVNKTNALFKLLTNKEVGDKVGIVDMRSEGILIHPGETRHTKVSFKLSRTYHIIKVRPFIAPLPADAMKIKQAGTVGVEFILDDRPRGRFLVNRDTLLIKDIDLTNVDIFTVVVDNGDGKSWFDWLMLGVVDSK